MDVLVTDLDKATARLGEQFARDEKPVAQVRQVRVDPQLPRVAEGLDLLGLTGCIGDVAVLDVPLAGGRLPIGAELDAIGRVDVDHLDLTPQVLPLRQ